MAKKLTPITEQYQHFVRELKESFWGDLYRGGQQALKQVAGSRVGAGTAAVPDAGRL